MAKCKSCPCKRTCRNECYGDSPCDFALAFDRMVRKVKARDDTIQKQRNLIEAERRKAAAPDIREFGDYVLVPVFDADSGKSRWWISKKGFTMARYCFTSTSEKEVEYQIKNGLSGYIRLLEET